MRDQKCRKTATNTNGNGDFLLFAKCQKKKLTKWIRKKNFHICYCHHFQRVEKWLCIAVICDFMIWANFTAATLLYWIRSQMWHSFGKYWIGYYRREWHALTRNDNDDGGDVGENDYDGDDSSHCMHSSNTGFAHFEIERIDEGTLSNIQCQRLAILMFGLFVKRFVNHRATNIF